jgi:hypothetical protein
MINPACPNLFCLCFADYWAVMPIITQGKPLLDGT